MMFILIKSYPEYLVLKQYTGEGITHMIKSYEENPLLKKTDSAVYIQESLSL